MQQLIRKLHGEVVFPRRASVLAREVCRLLPEHASVLDVGAGDGAIAGLCQAMRPDITIEGVDVLLRPRTMIPVRRFDGKTLPFEDRSWDVVLFVDVLHHVDDPRGLVREAARVARQAVVIKDHTARNRFDFLTLALMDWVGNRPHGVALPYNFLSWPQWDDLFAGERLEAAQVSDRVPLYPFPLSAVFGRGLHFVGSFLPRREHEQAA